MGTAEDWKAWDGDLVDECGVPWTDVGVDLLNCNDLDDDKAPDLINKGGATNLVSGARMGREVLAHHLPIKNGVSPYNCIGRIH